MACPVPIGGRYSAVHKEIATGDERAIRSHEERCNERIKVTGGLLRRLGRACGASVLSGGLGIGKDASKRQFQRTTNGNRFPAARKLGDSRPNTFN